MSNKSRKTCQHPPRSAFIAFQGNRGATVWRCSQCGTEDVWRDSWLYFGSMECRVCQAPGITAVFCSERCAASYKSPDPATALEMARAGSPTRIGIAR